MSLINENFMKLQAGYLFPEIGRRIAAFKKQNPDAAVISMGIGDVTQPVAPAIIEAMHKAVDELATKQGFHGYGPDQGYLFLRDAIIENDFRARGVNNIDASEIFVSDGAKCDTGNIQEIFAVSNKVAVTDPVYPVYVDTNVMAGRTGQAKDGRYEGLVYMPCTAENNFTPDLPSEPVDLIYLCYPNNPTGTVATKQDLKKWVDWAKENKAIILFDAAYEAFITDPEIPHTIYEVEGAEEVAIEFRSYSKTAGFTGIRCAYTVVPKALKAWTTDGKEVDVHSFWSRRHGTKFNGASYISQVGAAASYSPEGKKQISQVIELYLNNAATVLKALGELGYTTYGGVNAPYIWMKTPDNMTSWEFFDHLLNNAHVVGTPGSGFGAAGEGYFRLTAFGEPENVKEAMQRFKKL